MYSFRILSLIIIIHISTLYSLEKHLKKLGSLYNLKVKIIYADSACNMVNNIERQILINEWNIYNIFNTS